MVGVNRIEPQPAIKANKEWGGLTQGHSLSKDRRFPQRGRFPSISQCWGVGDGLNQRLKWRAGMVGFQTARANPGDHFAEGWIDRGHCLIAASFIF